MNPKAHTPEARFQIHPIGAIRRSNGKTNLEILEPYIPALKELGDFSHVQVFWWFNEFQDDEFRQITQSEPPYEAPTLGVFACRSPIRPNPVGLTTAKILDVDQDSGIVEIANIDAYDGTPIIDLKPYFPVCDRVQNVSVPRWAAEWPEWMPEEGLGLEE